MKIYVATYDGGGVAAAGVSEDAVKAEVEQGVVSHSSEMEWREEGPRRQRLYYRMADTGRWNKIPGRFIEAVEVMGL